MTSSEKQTLWASHIEGWRSSGLSQKAYCAKHALSFASFGYWRKRFSKASKLIPVTMPNTPIKASVLLPNGIRIDVPVEALAQLLPLFESTR